MTLADIRNSLLPDNALSARYTTTVGPDLSQVSGTVYAGAHDEDQRILWYTIEEKLIPTGMLSSLALAYADIVSVYTLWKNPHLIPLLHTPDFVVQKLQNGSPLMIPGLAHGPPFPSKAVKGACVAIASIDRPTVPLVVGTCEIDVAKLGSVQGAKGHAVRSEHWEGDELWGWSLTGKSGIKAPEHLEGWSEEELERDMEKVTLGGKEEEEGVGHDPQVKNLHNEFVDGEDAGEGNKKDFSTKEVDDVFWQAFLYGVHNARSKHKDDPRHGLNFPISQSKIISDLTLPFLPIHATSLNIKKTSWKNAKKFIKALDKAKILKSKDRDGGECVVLDIDFEDQSVVTFQPYKLPKKSDPTSDPKDTSLSQNIQIIILYKPKESVARIFPSNSLHLPSELRTIITTYLERESLIDSRNKRLVNLTPYLSHTLFPLSINDVEAAVVAKNSIPRDALIDRIRDNLCTPHYIILRNDQTRNSPDVKPRPGKPPRMTVTMETRGGNKVVTKVTGLEAFAIEPRLLGDELQRLCASSVSVGQATGSSPKQPVMEVLVQGAQRERVLGAVEKRGVKREWVDVVDKTKGKGRR